MNYAEARQRESTGRWDWTIRNDDQIWRATPCAEHADGHATREEAERHFWEHEIATARFHIVAPGEASSLQRCAVCSTFTASYARLADGYTMWYLCPDHHTKDALEALHPFAAGRTLMYS